MKIAIGADHAGYNLKEQLIPVLKGLNCEIIDVGTHSAESVDYPDFAHPVAISVEEKECAFGILICGSGNGVNITANKHQGIRSALCWNVEISKLARQHNDANIIPYLTAISVLKKLPKWSKYLLRLLLKAEDTVIGWIKFRVK